MVEKVANLVFLDRSSASDSTSLHAEVQALLGLETLSESKEVAHILNIIDYRYHKYCLLPPPPHSFAMRSTIVSRQHSMETA